MPLSEGTAEEAGRTPLLEWTVCPNCWHRFDPSDVLFVARHEELIGDPVLGRDFLRFRPSRFTLEGAALDPRGLPCHQVACPRCHIEMARALLELRPVYISIVGAPASGKSYFLGAMTWELRRMLPRFGVAFHDADPELNQMLHGYEEPLFLSNRPDELTRIEKTAEVGRSYREVTFDGQAQRLPRPFQFTLTAESSRRGRILVLYDNAGEHFLPGQDITRTPVTHHLAKSAAILFVFDPTQDPRLRARFVSDDPQLQHGLRPGRIDGVTRQETVLTETASRVRRDLGLRQDSRHDRPLVIILTKADIWIEQLLGVSIDTEPLIEANGTTTIDTDRIGRVSDQCRAMLKELCPEFVSAADAFCTQVTYIPATALGRSPDFVQREPPEESYYGIRPRDITPKWVAAPLLHVLHGVVPTMLKAPEDAANTAPGEPS